MCVLVHVCASNKNLVTQSIKPLSGSGATYSRRRLPSSPFRTPSRSSPSPPQSGGGGIPWRGGRRDQLQKNCAGFLYYFFEGMVVLSITLSIPRQDHSSARRCSISFRREGHCRWSLLCHREAPPVERAGEGGQVQGGPGKVRSGRHDVLALLHHSPTHHHP